MNELISTHNLDFEAAPWDDEYSRFRIGTCEGLYGYDRAPGGKAVSLDILAVQNRKQGNGHFEDVLQWFEFSAKNNKLPLRIIELTNPRLFVHLIEKRGFVPQIFAHQINVIKDLNKPPVNYLLDPETAAKAKEIIRKIAAVMEMVQHIALTDIPGDDDRVPGWAEIVAEKCFW